MGVDKLYYNMTPNSKRRMNNQFNGKWLNTI